MTHEDTKPTDHEHQRVGTAPFDIFPAFDEWYGHFQMDREPNMGELGTYHFGHLPAWVSGNAYFHGATVSKHEGQGYEDRESQVILELKEENGKAILTTNLPELLKNVKVGLVSSDTLGCAFEPEERFEQPDGTDILFDRDYFGNHRGLQAMPGPFETDELSGVTVFSI